MGKCFINYITLLAMQNCFLCVPCDCVQFSIAVPLSNETTSERPIWCLKSSAGATSTLIERVSVAAKTGAMSLSTWPSALPAHCTRRLQQQHTKTAPCATSQTGDQTSMFTIGTQSKLLITVNVTFQSRDHPESTPVKPRGANVFI